MRSGILASVIVLLFTGNALAQEHPEHPQASEPKGDVITATITGENFCVGCELKAEHSAAAQCDVYGHRHALRVTSVSGAGDAAPEMEGWVLHYLPNDKGDPFITGHHNETLKLTGKVYVGARVLEVQNQETGDDGASETIRHRR